MKTKRTGVREAKARLSKLLRDVQRGQEWVITERGNPVERLSPISGRRLPLAERIRRLEGSGLVEPLHHAVWDLPPPLPLKDVAQNWLQEDRSSRRLNAAPDWKVVRALSSKWPLRGAGLWHLAVAKSLQGEVLKLTILSFDARLEAAAKGEGLA